MRRPRIKATGEGFYHVASRIVGRRFLLDAQGDRPDISPIPSSHSPPLRDFARAFPSFPFPLRKAPFQPHPIRESRGQAKHWPVGSGKSFPIVGKRAKNFPIIGKVGRFFPTIGKKFSNHWKTPVLPASQQIVKNPGRGATGVRSHWMGCAATGRGRRGRRWSSVRCVSRGRGSRPSWCLPS